MWGALLGMMIDCARLRNLPTFGSMSSISRDGNHTSVMCPSHSSNRGCERTGKERTRIDDLHLVGEAQREQRHPPARAAPGVELRRHRQRRRAPVVRRVELCQVLQHTRTLD